MGVSAPSLHRESTDSLICVHVCIDTHVCVHIKDQCTIVHSYIMHLRKNYVIDIVHCNSLNAFACT